jgi:hypothetical protein
MRSGPLPQGETAQIHPPWLLLLRPTRAAPHNQIGPLPGRSDDGENSAPQISASRRGGRRIAGRRASGAGTLLSDAAGHDHRAVCAGRRGRRYRAHRRRTHVAHARAALRRREFPRRRGHHGFDPCDARQSRRLHHSDRAHRHPRHLGVALSSARLQAGRRLRADRRGRGEPDCDHGTQGFSRQRIFTSSSPT